LVGIATICPSDRAGLLFYASARLLRSALLIGYEVSEFYFLTEHNVSGAVRGVAFANSRHVFAGSTAGTIGLGCGVLLTTRVELLSKGTGELAMTLASSGVACLVCFVSSMFGIADDQTKLTVLFGGSTCLDEQGCQAAFLSRRLVSTLPQPAAMLFLAIGLLVLAYPPALRLNSRAAAARWSWTYSGLFVGGLAGLLIWSFVLPYFATWRGINLSILILTAWLSIFADTFSASVIASGVLISALFGTDWLFHNWCCLVVIGCLLLHTVASVLNLYGTSTKMFKSAVWLFAPSLRDETTGLDIVLGGAYRSHLRKSHNPFHACPFVSRFGGNCDDLPFWSSGINGGGDVGIGLLAAAAGFSSSQLRGRMESHTWDPH
jgi:hypothetical protein